MKAHYADDMVSVYVGDCRKVLPQVLADESVDAVVCDPPYELGFMGRGWDASGVAFDPLTWAECLRVLKPGGHLLAFGGTRTWHRVAVAIEDAGLDLRDTLMWIYGSGFPKSLDVSKAIDKAAGAEREVVGQRDRYRDGRVRQNLGDRNEVYGTGLTANGVADITAAATEDARRWEGWGTALKPGWEPIILARKPFAGTVAQNVVEYGTGALNIAACRIGDGMDRASGGPQGTLPQPNSWGQPTREGRTRPEGGRWPTNLIFTHSASCVEDGPCDQESCPVAELDRQAPTVGGNNVGVNPAEHAQHNTVLGEFTSHRPFNHPGGKGGASRFFPVFRYEAKAPSSERPKLDDGTAHATVKPLDLMRWLVRLITPPGGLVLDPFGGSGTSGEAALIEGFHAVLVELEQPHAELIKARLSKPVQPVLDLGGAGA